MPRHIAEGGALQSHRSSEQDGVIVPEVGTDGGVRKTTHNISDGVTSSTQDNIFVRDTNLWGSVFCLTNTETKSGVYKVETLQYNEEGLVDLTLTTPVNSDLKLLTLDWRDEDFYEYN